MHNYYNMGGYSMIILWIVILAFIGFSVYYFKRNKSIIGWTTETPLDILNKRYASGELAKEQYEHMKNDLK